MTSLQKSNSIMPLEMTSWETKEHVDPLSILRRSSEAVPLSPTRSYILVPVCLRRDTDPLTMAHYVQEAFPEQLFLHTAAWLDNQDQTQDVGYKNLKSYLDPTTNKPWCMDLLWELWLQCLPPYLRSALYKANDSPMNNLISNGTFITDSLSSHRFLVDTGVFCSLFPDTVEDKTHSWLQPSHIKLIAANESTVPMYSTQTIPI